MSLLAIVAVLFAQAADPLTDGLKALDANQPAAAEPLFRKALETDPTNYGAHFNLALALSMQQKDPEAIAELRKTLELKPGLYEADINLGILLLRNKQASAALPVLREAAETKPKEARPGLYYAQALLDSGEAAQAESHYAALAEAYPQLAPAQLGWARSLLAQSKLPEAADKFRAAGYKDGLLDVAAAYEKADRKTEAIALYKEFPDNAAVQERLSQLLAAGMANRNDAAAAIPDLEKAVHQTPNTANRLALADAYKLTKDNAKMLEQLQLATAADPNNPDLRMAYGRSLRDDHKLLPAAQQFLAATKLKPDFVPAWNELASALIVAENYAEGLAALDHIRALGKEIPGDYFLRAITLDKLKLKPQALIAYQQFLTADNGAHPDQDFQARQRMRIIQAETKK